MREAAAARVPTAAGSAPATVSDRGPPAGARVLVSTIASHTGGVRRMTAFVVSELRALGLDPVLAWYEPWSVSPDLSVPSHRLGRARPRARDVAGPDGLPVRAIGAWLPELEFTHYLPTRAWRALAASCRHHVAVSGNCLAATPFAVDGRAFLAWVASPWQADRSARVARHPLARRALDRAVIAPVTRRVERRILARGRVLALSDYTRAALDRIAAPVRVAGVLRMPIDTARFRPARERVVPATLGFVGRLDDPRKNVALLVAAAARLARRRGGLRLVLVGGALAPDAAGALAASGLGDRVEVVPFEQHDRLAARLQTLDAFVVPSHQEGLCIAALEAMASGCPVISTRCGGPEEYVHEGESGHLADADPDALARAVARVIDDRAHRDALARGARRVVARRYGIEAAARTFRAAFADTFPGALAPPRRVAR